MALRIGRANEILPHNVSLGDRFGQPDSLGGMMTKRLALLVGILALGLLFHFAPARAQAPPGPIPQAQEQQPAPGTLDLHE